MHPDQIPDLCVSALKAFKSSSHEFIRFHVTAKMLKVNKLIMNPTSATAGNSTTVPTNNSQPVPDDLDPLKMLQGIKALYIALKQQNNYPPGEQPAAPDKKLKALQGEVKKLKKKLSKLTMIKVPIPPLESPLIRVLVRTRRVNLLNALCAKTTTIKRTVLSSKARILRILSRLQVMVARAYSRVAVVMLIRPNLLEVG
jgi:hypothetical protein